MITPWSRMTRCSRAPRPIWHRGSTTLSSSGNSCWRARPRKAGCAGCLSRRQCSRLRPAKTRRSRAGRRRHGRTWPGRDLGIGPKRPAAVIEIQLRHYIGQVDIGFPIGVHGSDIAPIGLVLVAGAHAGAGKTMGYGLGVGDQPGNDVLAEITDEPDADASRRNWSNKNAVLNT